MKWRCSVRSDSLQPHGLWSTRLLGPWDFPGMNTGVGCHFLLQGIFPTQGSNPGLPHCRQTLYHLSYQGSPILVGSAIICQPLPQYLKIFNIAKYPKYLLQLGFLPLEKPVENRKGFEEEGAWEVERPKMHEFSELFVLSLIMLSLIHFCGFMFIV